MEISKEKVVSIIYELRQDTENGKVVEQVTHDQPFTFLFGTGGMLPRFEAHLEGLKQGEQFKFGLSSEEAYGPVVENAIVDISIDVFKIDGEIDNNILKLDNMVPMQDNNGNRLTGKITEIGESMVTMDFNHPMAGKSLYFTGEVTEVRDATESELAHGHTHSHNECNSHEDPDNCENGGEGGCSSCGNH